MRRELAGGYELDDDVERIDLDAVHRYLAEVSYWAEGRPRAVVEDLVRSAARVVGVYHGDQQVGFARAFSDGHTLSYLADVYVLEEPRGRVSVRSSFARRSRAARLPTRAGCSTRGT